MSYKRKIPQNKTCPGCGSSFIVAGDRKKFCSRACLAKYGNAVSKAEFKAKGMCPACGKYEPAPDRKLCQRCLGLARAKGLRKKQQIHDAYGNICACCGETNQGFLTIDHINNDGAAYRRKFGKTLFYLHRFLVQNNFPDDYQLLCWNCNAGRFYSGTGICPHKAAEKPRVLRFLPNALTQAA